MVHINSQSNITVHERESDLMCKTYLELVGSCFSLIIGVFIFVVPSSPFSEGILQLFRFFCTVGYPLQLCSVSRAGYFIFLPNLKKKCCRIFQQDLHGAVVIRELKFFLYFLVWLYFRVPIRLISQIHCF